MTVMTCEEAAFKGAKRLDRDTLGQTDVVGLEDIMASGGHKILDTTNQPGQHASRGKSHAKLSHG